MFVNPADAQVRPNRNDFDCDLYLCIAGYGVGDLGNRLQGRAL